MNKYLVDIPIGNLRGIGPLGLEGERASTAVPIFNRVLSAVVGILTVIAFIWFIYKVIVGAIGILTSGGDKTKLADARGNITYGVIGLVIVISAIFIINLIGYLIGVDIMRGAWFVPSLAP